MRERNSITILCITLLVVGGLSYYFSEVNALQFTFKSAAINSTDIHENNVDELLIYEPSSREYHTLYRNFLTPITIKNDLSKDNIIILDVKCSAGTAYYKDSSGTFYSEYSKSDIGYTERNEYGCGFGETTGFKKNTDYELYSEYSLNAKTLTEFNGRHYIKFVAYGRDNHPLLIAGDNLAIPDKFISKRMYMASEDVIIYVPYEPAYIEEYNILTVNKLDFGNSDLRIFKILFFIIPVIACFIIWKIFGEETVEGNYPEELSQPPKERKAWEVAAYFTPPFGKIDKNFNSTMLMDFYNRKIIDIKTEKKTSKIKILKGSEGLDEVERGFYGLLLEARKMSKKFSDTKQEYFDIADIGQNLALSPDSISKQLSIEKLVEDKSKEYYDTKGVKILFGVSIPLLLISLTILKYWIIYVIIILIIFGIVSSRSSLFIRYKKEYYPEYQKWQGFKNYLSTLDSMKRSPPQGAILWEKYLVYATALGVGRKVLDTLKKWKAINVKTYEHYNTVYATPMMFSGTGAGGGTGGFSGGMGGGGGFSGGGMGGGGGGGR